MIRKEIIGACELYLGDCREVLPMVGEVDAVVTDPPYGISLSGKRSVSTARRRDTRGNVGYASYDDTPENFASIVLPAIEMALSQSKRGLVFMSSRNVQKLPLGEVGGIYLPSATGRGPWGFQSFMHAVLYGPDTHKGRYATGKYAVYANDVGQSDHPCAKPLAAMRWAVHRASLDGHAILDPFMGSGTTGVACVKLGRRFIGIEIEPKYFDIACKRIEAATKQPDLFIEQPEPAEQLSMLDAAE